MKKITKKQTLLIFWLALCSAALIYLLIINIHSIIEAAKYLKIYLNAREQSLIVDMTSQSIDSLISQLTTSIVRSFITIVAVVAMYTTTAILLVRKIINLGAKNSEFSPAV